MSVDILSRWMFGQEDVLSGIQIWPNANRTSEHFVRICDQGNTQCSEPVCLRLQATVAFDSCALFTAHSSVHYCRLVSKSKKSEQCCSFLLMYIFLLVQWAGFFSWFNQFRNRGSKSLSAILSAVGNWESKIPFQWKRNLTTLSPRFTKKRTQATQESGRKDGRRWDGGPRDWWHI